MLPWRSCITSQTTAVQYDEMSLRFADYAAEHTPGPKVASRGNKEQRNKKEVLEAQTSGRFCEQKSSHAY